MKLKYLPIEDKRNIKSLKKAETNEEIITILESIFQRPYTLQVLWEYRKWYYKLSKEELDEHLAIKTSFVQIKIMEGNLMEAQQLINELEDDTYYKVYSQLMSPSGNDSFIYLTNEMKKNGFAAISNMTITGGRPSVLSGIWDFSEYTEQIINDKGYLDEAFEILFAEKGREISEMLYAEVLYQRDQCYESLVEIVGLLPFLKDRKDMRLLFSALTHEMFIMLLNNQVASAQPIMESLRNQIIGVGLEEYTPNIDALEAWVAMYEGDYRAVTKWMREDAPDEHSRFCMLDVFRYMIKMRVYLIQGKYLAITFLASKLQLLLDEGGRYMDSCELHLLWALSEYSRGDKHSALDHLSVALDLAEKFRLDRLIADEGFRVYELLKIYQKERGSYPYLEREIELSRKIAISHPNYLKAQLPEKPALTPAEMNVLRLLEAGHSNAEIARLTDTTIDNAKFHCKRIFSKLEVSNRYQAVKKAIELGILNPVEINY